jgi:ribosome biogenesis GTPase
MTAVTLDQVEATVIKKYSSQLILNDKNNEYVATTKAKKSDFVVGDKVIAEIASNQQARILKLIPRITLVFRSDHNRSKLIASNVSQVFIVITSRPQCNLQFLNACLVFCESQQITPVILINKSDLTNHDVFYQNIYSVYNEKLNYNIISINALADITVLTKRLVNNSTLLIGQSGVGKSTITSKILNYEIRSGHLSTKGKGCHTTTATALYYIDKNSNIIDSPGLDNFGISQINEYQLSRCFVEFRPYISLCKFRNCLHVNEPGCAVLDAFNKGIIDIGRYKSYLNFINKT